MELSDFEKMHPRIETDSEKIQLEQTPPKMNESASNDQVSVSNGASSSEQASEESKERQSDESLVKYVSLRD